MMPSPLTETWFIAAIVAVFGLMIGSFLNVVIFRLPEGGSIVAPASRCPRCLTPLSAFENIPVVSWLFLKGRCRSCQVSISWRYPATELATAALFLAVYQAFGLSLQSGFLLVLMGLLIATFWIDIDHMVILDAITLPGALIGLVYSALVTHQFLFSLAALLFGVAALLLINGITRLLIGQDGVGGGDLTLVAMLGAWLGLQQTVLALGLAMLIGALMGLGLLFGRWGKARRWQPFALAFGVAVGGYAAFIGFLGVALGGHFPEMLYGAPIAVGTRVALVALSALLGACAGWLYMRTTQDEGYLEMPFGPALVLGALGSLFFGIQLMGWYTAGLGF
jgi:leader peptidase (prepilin peptidase)/N-methyltransferase